MSDMNHERFEDLKDAYALGALPEDERRAMEAYLEAHPELRSEVEELSTLSNLLAFSPEEHEPPPELRENILRAVAAETEEPAEARPALWESLRARLSAQRLALGGAAILLVALLSWNIALQAGDRNLQTFELQGSGPADEVRAEVVEMDEGKFVLVAENMPPMPEDKTMQIWVIEDGKPKPGRTFRPEDGLAAAPVGMPLQGADAVAVTVEPAGGSEQPTTDPVLQAKL